jgi:hypothetical protein
MTGSIRPFRLDGGELAGYRIESLIGRGGMAFVYRAVDQRLGRTVALKVLAPELAGDAEFRRRFLRESRLAASLDHPNIIPIYDAGEADGMLYIAMRYVDGSDLKAVLAQEPQLGTERLIDIFTQVADALDEAHNHGLVHRDVKPANILIAPRSAAAQGHEHVYLSDFGVTKRATSLSGVTAPGVIVGTMDYLAPEQIAGKAVSTATDVYALGCVVFQALTGAVPYVRDDDAALLWAHLTEVLPAVWENRADVPPTAQTPLWKATAKEPEDRYATCREFIADLATELRSYSPAPRGDVAVDPHAPTGATAAPTSPSTAARVTLGRVWPPPDSGTGRTGAPAAVPRQGRGRHRWAWVAVGVAVAVALALGGFFLMRPGDPGTKRFPADNVVPVSFSYPADWKPAAESNKVVLSPQATAVLPLFARLGQPQDWAEIGRLLRDDQEGVVGLYTFFNQAEYSGGDRQALLEGILPGVWLKDTKFDAHLGGTPAIRISGTLTDPADGANQLRFACYVAQSNGRAVHMILFSAVDTFEDNQKLFDRIAASAELAGG